MGRVFKRFSKDNEVRASQRAKHPAGRLSRIEQMVFESNAYIVRLLKAQADLSDADKDFLEAAEEFRSFLASGGSSNGET